MQPVALRLEDAIAWITFGEPSGRNLLTEPLLAALPRALAQAESRARVVVLRGRGEFFSAGYDIGQIPRDLFRADPATVLEHPFESCMRAVVDCALPTIAAVNGDAIGGALELAVSCDLRVARAGARFGITAARLGLVYPHAGLQKLLRLLGPAHTRRLLFTGELVETDEALHMGLVNRVADVDAFDGVVAGLARRIAAAAPLAVRGMKQILRLVERQTALSDADVMQILALREQSFHSEDFQEGRSAFAERRDPRFRGR